MHLPNQNPPLRVKTVSAEASIAFVAVLIVLLFQAICFGIFKLRGGKHKQQNPEEQQQRPHNAGMQSTHTLPCYEPPQQPQYPSNVPESTTNTQQARPALAQPDRTDTPPPPYVERPEDAHTR